MIVSLGSAGQISGREYRPDTHLSQTLHNITACAPLYRKGNVNLMAYSSVLFRTYETRSFCYQRQSACDLLLFLLQARATFTGDIKPHLTIKPPSESQTIHKIEIVGIKRGFTIFWNHINNVKKNDKISSKNRIFQLLWLKICDLTV